MKTMTVRNVPESLYRALVAQARRNGRSLQRQVMKILEQAVERDPGADLVERARALRERLEGRDLGDTVAEVRADRER